MRKTRDSITRRKPVARRLSASVAGWSKDNGLHIGISGWTYPPWRGVFYPGKLPHRLELQFASRAFNSIEINGSFYSLQRPSSYQRWYAETPPGFIFSVKGPRFITHMKKLREIKAPLVNFFASGVLCLQEKLGPILWQFPPSFGWNEGRFGDFFELLPRDTASAAKLARKHDNKLKVRAWAQIDKTRPVRYAVEIRHPTFMVPEFFALLRQYNIAFVFADTARKWPYSEDLTADFVYCRLHGDKELYASGYAARAFDWWAARVRKWRQGRLAADAKLVAPNQIKPAQREVYVYFDNDAKVHAPFNAKTLAARFGIRSLSPPTP